MNNLNKSGRTEAFKAFMRYQKECMEEKPEELPAFIAYAFGAIMYAAFIGDIDKKSIVEYKEDLYQHWDNLEAKRKDKEV